MTHSTEIVHEFLIESHENLDELDRDLVALEQDPDSAELLGRIFRTIHTIKGTCGFLGFSKLERVTHAGENLLSRLRDGELRLVPDITTGLLRLVDAVRQILGHIEVDGGEGDEEFRVLIECLVALQQAQDAIQVDDDCQASLLAEPDSCSGVQGKQSAQVQEERPTESDAPPIDPRSSQLSDGSIRVDVGLLDKLMNQVGELVLARNQILQFTSSLQDASFLSTSQRLNLITTELQEGVMKTRMQPIGNVWAKFPRVVRDLAHQCGKQVHIEMEGRETELDKTIIEAIKDPLTHLVRNAVDHGLEPPEQRKAAGKPETGRLLFRAFHEGGQVNIEVIDDGAGLNLPKIRQRAIDRGIITSEQSTRMSDRDAAMLIFSPGFSTAAQITNVSGRGVGMDVVKSNVEKIGGTVDIVSEPGKGSIVKLKIPLTLAIIPALIVTCAGDRFAIPQVSLLELVRLEGDAAQNGIERLNGALVYRLRGQLLPIIYLKEELGIDSSADTGATDGVVNIVVLQADGQQFGLVVDAINDTEEIVVKPLGAQLKTIPTYAGATIMGDGTVALIIDVLSTAQQACILARGRDSRLSSQSESAEQRSSDHQSLLILAVGDRRVAIPTSLVARLEEISPSDIENADGQQMIQYRGQILPLIRMADVLGVTSAADPERPLQLVIYREGEQSVGLVVDRIADIVESSLDIQRTSPSQEIIAAAVIQQRVTELLDLPAIIRQCHRTPFIEPSVV